VNTGSFPKYR
jgi:hypothetical protein